MTQQFGHTIKVEEVWEVQKLIKCIMIDFNKQSEHLLVELGFFTSGEEKPPLHVPNTKEGKCYPVCQPFNLVSLSVEQ